MRNRLGNIDGLRGIAATLVLFQHLCERADSLAPPGTHAAHSVAAAFLTFIDLGKVGVVTFFAISGFVVPFSFKDETGGSGFILSRFFRLYPAYWLSLLLAVLILPTVSAAKLTAPQIFANVTMLQEAVHSADVLSVYWTLFVELLFYALCLAMYKTRCLHSPRALFVAFCLLLSLSIAGSLLRSRGHAQFPVAIPLYLATMLFGTEVRLARFEGNPLAPPFALTMLPLLAIAIPAVWMTAYGESSHRETAAADIFGFYLALALFLLCVMRNSFAARPLIYLGSISYSVYLFHPIALDVGSLLAARARWPLAGWLLALSTLALTFAVAHLTFVTLERPMIRIGRKVATWLEVMRAAPPEARTASANDDAGSGPAAFRGPDG